MKWLADECISTKIVSSLRGAGHDVTSVIEQSPSTKDRDILAIALQQQRLLLTGDKDFGELIFGGATQPSFGIVLMRIPDGLSHLAWPRLQEAIAHFGEGLLGRFTVIEETRLRTRPLREA